VVNGIINGPVQSTESLELSRGRGSKVTCTTNIEIHRGAVVEGRLVHHGAEAKGVELKLAGRLMALHQERE
jgi:cytoskeletal protein CcmA (bactofilin family)